MCIAQQAALIDLTDTTRIKLIGDYTHSYDNNTYRLAQE